MSILKATIGASSILHSRREMHFTNSTVLGIRDPLPFEGIPNARRQMPGARRHPIVIVSNSNVGLIWISTAYVHGVKDGKGKPKMQLMESPEPSLREPLEHPGGHDISLDLGMCCEPVRWP